jgi:glycosyltransferase involved in cell wall biosynthesis
MRIKAFAKHILKKIPYPLNTSILRAYELYYSRAVTHRLSKEQREILKKINSTKTLPRSAEKKTRILFYHISGLSSGGTEKFLQIIAKHLDRSKFDVFFMYSPKPRSSSGGIRLDSRKSYLPEDTTLVEFDYTEIEQKYPYFVVDQKPTIHEIIEEHNIDLVCTAGSGYTEYPINTITKVPIVLINIFGSPSVQPNIKKHISISHAVDAMIKPYISADKREVIYIQSEDPLKTYSSSQIKEMRKATRAKFNIPEDAFVFGRIGRADDNIFDPIGINAFEQVVKKYPSAHYLIMSTPPILEKIVKERNIPNVHFLPPSGLEADVWSFHFAIDTLAHFRLDGESFGLNIAESMIAGNPIITHKSHIWNAHLEYLDPSFSFVVEKDDVDGYVKAMESLIKNATLGEDGKMAIKVMQDKAREQAEKLFLIEGSIRKIEDILML